MTLSWPRLTWPAWETRQAGPRWRRCPPPRPLAVTTAARQPGIFRRKSSGLVTWPIVLIVSQRMNADPLGDAGTPGGQANDPMQLARTRMLPAVAGKQPGLTGSQPFLR